MLKDDVKILKALEKNSKISVISILVTLAGIVITLWKILL